MRFAISVDWYRLRFSLENSEIRFYVLLCVFLTENITLTLTVFCSLCFVASVAATVLLARHQRFIFYSSFPFDVAYNNYASSSSLLYSQLVAHKTGSNRDVLI